MDSVPSGPNTVPVIGLPDPGIIVDVPDQKLIKVRMRRLVFRVHDLLSPGVALDGQVDKRDQAVYIKRLRRFQISLGTHGRVCGPRRIIRPDQPAVDYRKDWEHRHPIRLLMGKRRKDPLHRIHTLRPFQFFVFVL